MHRLLYNTILFDLDGTLIESGPCIFAVTHEMLKTMGLRDIPDDALRPMVGPPLRTGFAEVLAIAPERIEEAVGIYRGLARTVGLELVKPYDGILELLAALKAAHAAIGVVTSKVASTAKEHIALYGIGPYIDYVAGASEQGSAEKTGILRSACEAFAGAASSIVMIGDRRFDIEAANAVGMPSIGAAYGYGGMDELTASLPTHIVESVSELKKLLIS